MTVADADGAQHQRQHQQEQQIVNERIGGHWTLDEERWRAHDREHTLEHRSLMLATDALERRLEGLNEFRAQLGDQAKGFLTIDVYDRQQAEFTRRMDDLRLAVINIEKGDVKQEGRGLGQAGAIAAIIAAISVTATLVGLFILVAK